MVYLINFGSTNPFNNAKSRVVKFQIDSNEIVIGRDQNADLQANAAYISNRHCCLKKEDEVWKLSDCGSSNGTFLNGNKLKSDDWNEISHGDVIQIGPQDCCKLKFYIDKTVKRKCSHNSKESGESENKLSRENQLQEELENLKSELQKALDQNKLLVLQEKQEANKIEESNSTIESLNQRLKDLEEQKQKEIEELTKLLNDKENDLMQKLEEQKTILGNQLNDLNANKDRKTEQVQMLTNELSAKEQLVEKMKIDLKSSQENGKVEARKEFISKLTQTVEEQFSCQICLETYVFAVTTDCGHSFCELCLRRWLANENKCPTCRNSVRAYPRNYVIDGYINGLYESLNKENLDARKKLVEDHKTEIAALANPRPGPSNRGGAAPRNQVNARRGGQRNRGGAPRTFVRRVTGNNQQHARNPPFPMIPLQRRPAPNNPITVVRLAGGAPDDNRNRRNDTIILSSDSGDSSDISSSMSDDSDTSSSDSSSSDSSASFDD